MKLFNLSFLLLAVCLGACSGGEQPGQIRRKVFVDSPLTVDAVEGKTFSGVIKEGRQISLAFRAAGQISHIYVKEGDRVKKGTLLATLDDSDYNLEVAALKAQETQMKAELERTRRLLEQKGVSANDLEKLESAYQQIAARLAASENKVDYTRLYAPCDCYVQAVNYEASEMVNAGTPVFELLDNSRIEVEVDIPVAVYRQRTRFSSFEGVVAGEKVTLSLVSIAPRADSNQLYRMKLALIGQHPGLTPGMNIEVMISLADPQSAGEMTIPVHSIVRRNDSTFVYVIEHDSVAKLRPVTLGDLNSDGRAIVGAGLNPGEKIIRSGVNMIADGDTVSVIDDSNDYNMGRLM